MRGPFVLLHVLGVTMWLGGGFASMVISIVTKSESAQSRANAARLLALLQQRVITPGVLIVLTSGSYLSTHIGPGGMDRPGILGMVASGMLAGLITLFLGLPTAMRRARAAQVDASGELPPVVTMLARRQAVVMTIGGVLALTALGFVYLG